MKIRLPKIGGSKSKANVAASPSSGEILPPPESFKKPAQDVMRESQGVIKIGKRSFAIELGRTLNDESGVDEQARKLPKGYGVQSWDLYMRPSGGRITFGSSDIGHKKGHHPLAESLDKTILGDEWAVAFKIDSKHWWFASSSRGTIADDTLMKDESDIRDAISAAMTPEGKVFASPSLGIGGAVDAEVWDVLASPAPALRKMGFVKNNLPRIVIGTLTVAAIFGSWTFYQSYMESIREQERQLAEAARQRVTINPEDFPWHSGYRLDDFLSDCEGAFAEAAMTVPGWEADPLTCSYQGDTRTIAINAGYRRLERGRIADLRSAYSRSAGFVSLEPDGQVAIYSSTWSPRLTPEYFDVQPWDAEMIQRVMVERFQNLDVPLSISGPGETNINARSLDRPAFFNHSVSLVTTGSPVEEVGLVMDVPAVVPHNIVWNPANNQWGMNFEINHPPIMPAGAVIPGT